MKLLNKSTLYFIIFLVPVFVVSWFVLFGLVSRQINDNADESLLAQKKIIIKNFIDTDSTELHFFNDADDDVKITSLSGSAASADLFSNTMAFDSTEMELVPFRQLKSTFIKDGKSFEIIVTRSTFKGDELAESISLALVIMFGLMLISVIIINRFISGRLFNPFYQTLEKLHHISFDESEPSFNQSSTREFDELNKALQQMTHKMFSDYNNQKQFTENASHELQTPLAVIKTRMDMLIQDKNLSEKSMEQIQEIEKSVNKLSHLNKSLVLLSKIENRQFEDSRDIDLRVMLDKILLAFEDDVADKNIVVQKEYNASPSIKINPLLAEILFRNLIQNSARHNVKHGIIKIKLTEQYFSISNSGESMKGNEEKLFERFTKFNPSVESLGLGLSIAKQICVYYHFDIRYQYLDGMHTFRVYFS
ncbi:MAG: HAMP domain-containing histidine kinase [Saprospiraceae bacterium]|uniref:histidine kinase n=1 Tax=Candidatus Opimibacter skivensis TaxID=2982028 RepID=A0A9D7XSL9_9BACT|nr:HAMP domain-containing histidine kinase [Candidatus Opimibacter skivensis]